MRAIIAKGSLVILVLAGCSGTSAQGTSIGTAPLSGPMQMLVADVDDDDVDVRPPADTAVHVVVTVAQIDARFEDGRPDDDSSEWMTVSTTTTTVDLLALQGGTFGTLGVAQLPAGSLEALRLVLSPIGPNYVVTADGVQRALVVPSGTESGIKIVGDFDVAACATGHVTLAFAGRKSIAFESSSGTWMLRPVIRIREVITTGACPASQGDDGNGQGDDGKGGPGKGSHGHGV